LNAPLLEIDQVIKWFPVRQGLFSRTSGYIKAVDDVSFSIGKGEILGLVGESGCGKSTLGRGIMHLLKLTSGAVYLEGENIIALEDSGVRSLRKKMQIIFQDPYSSLNPRLSIGSTLREVLAVHTIVPKNRLHERVTELLEMVGLNAFHARRYPHEFSSGQRQRIGIARALAVEPRFIVCDEPVSALDVSIQAQILNLLMDLRASFDLTYLFISHDLSVIKHISDRIAVMYLGKIVELGEAQSVIGAPMHPYTQGLLASAPIPDPRRKRERVIPIGDVPSPLEIPHGCPFHPRCPQKIDVCEILRPKTQTFENGHQVRCHLY
jgi:oligopeptide transport system ATP-binding protein